ncbi:DUF3223 domain-containing protein [Sanguibacter sp. 25GB23B1]|uniref:DUF3223 domain-containing protein n=1 Tax=unclassified Sanguibacter TaxID=2645534 RepID=UPI0032AED197
MVAKPVVLPNMSFPTRGAAKNWVRDNIKDAYDTGEIIDNPLHVMVLFDLLERDNDVEKIGVGVREFFINLTSRGKGSLQHVKRNARGIWIRRFDDSEDDWSYTSAIDQEGIVSDVKEALRTVVDENRVEFRERQFANGPVHCYRTGQAISTYTEAEVRYVAPSWAELTQGFAASQGGWDRVELSSAKSVGQIAGDLADDSQRSAWKAYWKAHARPVLVQKAP